MLRRVLIATLTATILIACSAPRPSGPAPIQPAPQPAPAEAPHVEGPPLTGMNAPPKPLCDVYVTTGQSQESLGHEATFAIGEPHTYWMVCPLPVQYPELIWGTRQFGISTNVTMQPVPGRNGTYAMKASFPAEGFAPGDVMVTYFFVDGELQGIVRVSVSATKPGEARP